MAIHSYIKVWIHLIWGTHNHEKVITKELGKVIYEHLVNKAFEDGIPIEKLHIRPEHVHMLYSLPSSKSLEDIAKSLKGESSFWINDNNITPFKFKWQRGYGAFSVSASQVEKVKRYIANQDEHHRVKTFNEEYDDWKKKYGIFDEN